MTAPARYEIILVPIDFSPCSRSAVELARDIALRAGPSHVILAHAFYLELEALAGLPSDPILAQLSETASKELEKILVELQDKGISAEFVVTRGIAERVILDLAHDKHADLIVMGTRGRTGLAHVALGSVAERVVRGAPCPVVTTRERRS